MTIHHIIQRTPYTNTAMYSFVKYGARSNRCSMHHPIFDIVHLKSSIPTQHVVDMNAPKRDAVDFFFFSQHVHVPAHPNHANTLRSRHLCEILEICIFASGLSYPPLVQTHLRPEPYRRTTHSRARLGSVKANPGRKSGIGNPFFFSPSLSAYVVQSVGLSYLVGLIRVQFVTGGVWVLGWLAGWLAGYRVGNVGLDSRRTNPIL